MYTKPISTATTTTTTTTHWQVSLTYRRFIEQRWSIDSLSSLSSRTDGSVIACPKHRNPYYFWGTVGFSQYAMSSLHDFDGFAPHGNDLSYKDSPGFGNTRHFLSAADV
jgi:hypothetical protein